MLCRFKIARVAADPAKPKGLSAAAEPGGWDGLVYYRLHGSPRVYYSAYGEDFLERIAARMKRSESEAWCVFDNTAAGFAKIALQQVREILPSLRSDAIKPVRVLVTKHTSCQKSAAPIRGRQLGSGAVQRTRLLPRPVRRRCQAC